MNHEGPLSAKGVLEVEAILKNAREVTRDIALLREGLNDTSAAGDRLEKKSRSVEKGLEGVTRSATATAAATGAVTGAVKQQTVSLIAQRYALYDVASTYGIISAALLASGGYAIKVGADFESAFTSVERTSNAGTTALAGLREELINLSTQVPLTFADLSKIATLGNQLGIPEQDIASFTQTVSKFATVTGLSVEAAATAFGSLGELLNLAPQDYEKLGSAIAFVGRNSVATEAEIVALTTRLAASATKAGFTAQEVVALSGALASLRVAPERAQGVLEVYFNRLNTALADGGSALQSFADVAGLSTDAVRELVATDPNKFFREFAAGLGRLDSVRQTQALDALGLSGIRAGEVFGRVAGNISVFDKALADSNSSYAAGTELATQYAKVVDDLNSRWMMFVNSINALIEALSGGLVPGIAGALEKLTELVNQARAFAESPIGGFIGALAIGLTTLVGVFFAYRSAVALATASTFALTTAQAGLASSGTALGIRGLVTALLGMSTAAGGATTKIGILKGTIAGLGKATALLALVDLLYNLVFLWDENADGATRFLRTIGVEVPKAIKALYQIGDATVGVQNGMVHIGKAAVSAGDLVLGALMPIVFLLKLLTGAFNQVKATGKAASTIGGGSNFDVGNANDYAAALGGVGGAAGSASREIRTLVDYGNDLSEVFKRAFDIRFSGGQGLDAISTGWHTIAQAIADTNQQIDEYRATMLSLTADKAVKEYWLSQAENYADALRAGQLRAELAQLDVDLKKTTSDLTKAQDKNSKTLVGNTDGAIANRAEILGLVTDYQSYIVALASSGLSQDELRTKTAQLKADFYTQATQLGYNTGELQMYASAFDDVTTAINTVPREITVDANMDPAIQALNEYLARVNASRAAPSIGGGGGAAGAADGDAYVAEFARAARARANSITVSSPIMRGASGDISHASGTIFDIWGNFASGGYTGNGGKYEPKGIVHGGEFVFSKKAVQNIGVSNLAFAHNMAKRGYANGGPVAPVPSSSGGMGVVQLAPYDRHLLTRIEEAIIDKPVLTPNLVSAATSAANTNHSNRRSA